MDCPFCEPPQERVFYQDDLILCLWDAFPVSEGHALVITRRHVVTWFDASPEEQAAVMRGVEVARAAISKRHAPDGFNIGSPKNSATMYSPPPAATRCRPNSTAHIRACAQSDTSKASPPSSSMAWAVRVGGKVGRLFIKGAISGRSEILGSLPEPVGR